MVTGKSAEPNSAGVGAGDAALPYPPAIRFAGESSGARTYSTEPGPRKFAT
jgi:hypothetical protein